jgi:hypothetical protein
MTTVATPVRREWPTAVACAIGAAPAVLFSAAWALTQYGGTGAATPFLVIGVALFIPGWAAWFALHAPSGYAVVVTAAAAAISGPMIQLIFVGGSRIVRALIFGWIGIAFLVGILVAYWIMRRASSLGPVLGAILGANAMILLMLPMILAVFVRM